MAQAEYSPNTVLNPKATFTKLIYLQTQSRYEYLVIIQHLSLEPCTSKLLWNRLFIMTLYPTSYATHSEYRFERHRDPNRNARIMKLIISWTVLQIISRTYLYRNLLATKESKRCCYMKTALLSFYYINNFANHEFLYLSELHAIQ